jgi:YHS domain-containing protein
MRFLFLLLIALWGFMLLGRALMWILRALLGGTGRPSPVRGGETNSVEAARRLVRDPMCGVHVAENLALPLRAGDDTLYFCSAACRDKYVLATKKYAANG